jgi:RNA polymerase sigma-54 factor
MALEIRQQLKMSQQLVMTPQLQQAIKLLQLSRMDLVDVVRGELMENPLLEEQSEIVASEARTETAAEVARREERKETTKEASGDNDTKEHENTKEQIDWESYVENYSTPTPGMGAQRLRDDDLPGVEATLTKTTTLFDHLMWQLHVSDFTDQEERVALAIIGNTDDRGFLTEMTVEEIAEELDQDVEYVEEVLEMVQEFDPVGVCARDLRECLLLQTRFYEMGAIVEDVVGDHMGNLEKKNYHAIAREMDIELDEVIEAARLISTLEPRPGRPFSGDDAQYITPDIYIRKVEGEYVTALNEDGMPKLKISNFYRNALLGNSSDETKKYVTEKLNSAQWLIRSIQQRQKTIVKVTESIIKFQRDFFDRGVEHLKPLILRDVAEDIGMHESTVSRVTNNKYVHTPRGIYELKYFFNSSINKTDGDNLASEAVKSKIKVLVGNEDPKKPFSDQKIVELLKKDGIKIARRTVAKYREVMGILPSSKRKRLF